MTCSHISKAEHSKEKTRAASFGWCDEGLMCQMNAIIYQNYAVCVTCFPFVFAQLAHVTVTPRFC